MKYNPFPFNWMGKKMRYIEQESCVGDIDFPWQLEATKLWVKNNKKK